MVLWDQRLSLSILFSRVIHVVVCTVLHCFLWLSYIIWGASLVPQRLKRLHPMRKTWVWSLGREDPLEKEMVTHSSILAWRIPWTEEPGRLKSTGSQRVGHDWAMLYGYFTFYPFDGWWVLELFLLTDYYEECSYELLCTRFLIDVFKFLLGYVLRNGMATSYSNSVFNLLRNSQGVFQSGCTILHSHQ